MLAYPVRTYTVTEIIIDYVTGGVEDVRQDFQKACQRRGDDPAEYDQDVAKVRGAD